MIYFVEAGESGPIKIGYTKMYVVDRLMFLQVGNPMPLRLLAYTAGTRAEERRLHDKFSAHRMRGEWFQRSDEILAHLRGVLSKPIVFRSLSYWKNQPLDALVNPDFYRSAPIPPDPWSILKEK